MNIKTKTFNIMHAVVGSVLVHLLFLNFLPDFSALDRLEPKRKFEKVRLDIIEKKIPLEKIKKVPAKKVFRKLVKSSPSKSIPIRPVKKNNKVTNPKVKPLPVPLVQEKVLMAKTMNVSPHKISTLKPLPVVSQKKTGGAAGSKPSKQLHSVSRSNISNKILQASPITVIKKTSKGDMINPYASKVVSTNKFLSKVLHDLKPKKASQDIRSSFAVSKGIAQMHSSKRVFISSFSPKPYPVNKFDVEEEKGNSLSKEELDGIWRKYTGSIQLKIEKAKKYPARAKRRKQKGKTFLSFKLDRDGMVSDLKVEKSSGHKILDQAALRAIKEGEPYPRIPETLNEKYAFLRIPISFVLR